MSEDKNIPDELEYQQAYLNTLITELREVERTVSKREKELDEILEVYQVCKKKLGLVYFLRDKIKKKIEQEQEYLEKFEDSLNESK